jgi:shikimate dehydrogenase
MRALGLAGLSVTMPFKADVARLVDQRTPAVERLGAANCVVRHGDRLVGHNTDGEGFVASLRRSAGFDPAGRRCLVAGAGGAARAVVVALADAGAAEVVVVNRTPERAAQAARLAGAVGRVGTPGDVARAELVVNATPVGMAGAGAADDPPLIDPATTGPGQVVADLVYHPSETAWLAAATGRGATAVGGLGMLVHQAAVQLTLWTGQPAPVEDMWRAVEAAVGAGGPG